jgi:hypothetical protein
MTEKKVRNLAVILQQQTYPGICLVGMTEAMDPCQSSGWYSTRRKACFNSLIKRPGYPLSWRISGRQNGSGSFKEKKPLPLLRIKAWIVHSVAYKFNIIYKFYAP